MFCSSEFSLDENSVWDPKAIRQLLIISEDQLDILNNIPEWTKEKDNYYYSRINENDSGVNTQVVQNPGNTLQRIQEVTNHNIQLFNKNSDSRENIIQEYKLKALKFSKSISLFEINKISENSHCNKQLSSALSLPNLSLFSKDFSVQFDSKSYLSKKTDLSTQLNLAVLDTGKRKASLEKTNMEVVSQLPAVVPQIIKNNENFAIVEKTVLSTNQTIQSPDSSSNSCDLLSTLVDVNKSDHHSSTATNPTILVEIDKLSSISKDAASNENKQVIVDSSDLVLQKTTDKLVEPTDSNVHEKMEIDSSTVKKSTVSNDSTHGTNENVQNVMENVDKIEANKLQVIVGENVMNNVSLLNKDENYNINVGGKIPETKETSVEISKQPVENGLQVLVEERAGNNADSSNKNKISNIDIEDKILNKVSESPLEISKHPGVDPKLCEPKVIVVSSDELKSKITDSLLDSRMNAGIDLNTACRGAGEGEAVTSQNHPLKRKSESKARSSKRSKSSRDKQGCSDERSIKKAGGISYSPEDTKNMFDLLKLFF